MKTIVFLGVVVLLLLFLNWRTEHLDVESSGSDLGPEFNEFMAQSLLKSWGPDKDKIEKKEDSTIEGFDGDLGPQINLGTRMALNRNWEPDPQEFEKIQRRIDKKADSRDAKGKSIACAIDMTQGGPVQIRNDCNWAGICYRMPDYGNHSVLNLAQGKWGDDFITKIPECNTVLPATNEYSAAMKCALDNNKMDDIVQLVLRNLKANEYLQRKECQGYFTTDDMFI